jgi:iron complex outermembrane receptor protein
MDTISSDVVASADYYWRDDHYQAEFNTVNNFQEAYGLLSARLDFQSVLGTGVNFAIWGRNLTEEEYFSATGDLYNSSGIVYRIPGEPRMYGIEISADF